MNWLEFLASIIKSLAWPTTLVILVVLFRAPVRRALLRLTRLKYKDLELDFGRELRQLEKEAKAIDITPQTPKSIAPTKRDSSQFLMESAALVQQGFPEPAVAVAWQAVEDELMQATMRLAISPDYPAHNSPLKNAELLKEQNAIDQRTIEVLNRMRNLRNMAVHGGRGAAHVTTDEAFEFLALARGVVEKLQELRRK
jgi:uncharacterized protein YutE (UPF0331/DUF86 family)